MVFKKIETLRYDTLSEEEIRKRQNRDVMIFGKEGVSYYSNLDDDKPKLKMPKSPFELSAFVGICKVKDRLSSNSGFLKNQIYANKAFQEINLTYHFNKRWHIQTGLNFSSSDSQIIDTISDSSDPDTTLYLPLNYQNRYHRTMFTASVHGTIFLNYFDIIPSLGLALNNFSTNSYILPVADSPYFKKAKRVDFNQFSPNIFLGVELRKSISPFVSVYLRSSYYVGLESVILSNTYSLKCNLWQNGVGIGFRF